MGGEKQLGHVRFLQQSQTAQVTKAAISSFRAKGKDSDRDHMQGAGSSTAKHRVAIPCAKPAATGANVFLFTEFFNEACPSAPGWAIWP